MILNFTFICIFPSTLYYCEMYYIIKLASPCHLEMKVWCKYWNIFFVSISFLLLSQYDYFMKYMIWWFITEDPPEGRSVFSSVLPSAMSIIYTETFTTIRDLCLLPDNDGYCSFVFICSQRSIRFYRATRFMADTSKLRQFFPVVQKGTSGNHCSIVLTEVK